MGKKTEEMSFLDHLEELRWCFVKSLVAIIVCAIPCGIYWKKIFDLLMIYPLSLSTPAPSLIYTSPAEPVILSFKIAIAGGIVCAAPVVFYQIWRFVSPGLYKKEKVILLPTVIASTFFFLLGIAFCYFMVPFVISFLTRYAAGKLNAFYRAQEYLGFLIKLMLAFGIVFELPVVSFVLTKMGLLTPKFMIDKIRYAIVIIFIVAAVLTPPDVISQLALAAPLLLLYGISILVSWIVMEKKKSD